MSAALPATVTLSDETVEAIAQRAAEIATERLQAVSPWMTVDSAAAYLGWSRDRLYKLTAANAVPHRKHGNRVLFHRGELDAWLEGFRQGPASPVMRSLPRAP